MRPSRSGSPLGLARLPVAVGLAFAFVGGLVSGPVSALPTKLPPFQLTPPPSASAAVGRGEVTIPAAEYRSLLEGAEGSAEASAPGARIENARFRIAVSAESATFEERFDVRVAGAGWLSVPVVRSALDQASIVPADRGAFFVARDLTRLALLGPGSGSGTLGTSTHVGTDASGRQSFSLTMPLFAVQQGRVELPGVGLEITVGGGELLARSEQKGATLLEVAVRPGALLSVGFREQNLSEKGRSAALRASAVLYSRSDVVGGNLVTDVTVRITASAGRIAGVAFEVPKGSQVLYLRGAGLLAAENDGSRVRASRVTPSPDPLEAQLRLTRPIAEGTPVELVVPRLVLGSDGPVEAYAELRPPPGVLVEMTAPGGFDPVELDKIPAPLRALAADSEEVLHVSLGEPAAGRRVEPAVYQLHRLDAAPVLVAQVRAARGHTVVSSNGRALTRVEYEVVSSAKPFLTIHLPAGSRFWGAEAMGRPILPAMPETGSIAVPLRGGRRRMARVAIYVLSSASGPESRGRGLGRSKGTLEFQPPGTDIPISAMTWTFSMPEGADYRLEGNDYRPGAGSGGMPAEAAAATWQSELGQKAQEALARESTASGRAPITPRMPDLRISAIVRAELPGSPPKPIRFEVRPTAGREEWQ